IPSSRRPYSSRGCIPAVRASLVVNVIGSDATAPLDTRVLISDAPRYYYIQLVIPACVFQRQALPSLRSTKLHDTSAERDRPEPRGYTHLPQLLYRQIRNPIMLVTIPADTSSGP